MGTREAIEDFISQAGEPVDDEDFDDLAAHLSRVMGDRYTREDARRFFEAYKRA